jgi:hypothetical protein
MPAEERSEFEVYRLRSSWGVLGPSALDVAEAMEGGAETIRWVFPQDHARLGKRVVRIRMANLAQEVLDSNGSSLSVLVATPSVSRQALAGVLGSVQLTVRYGFLGDAAPAFRSGRN